MSVIKDTPRRVFKNVTPPKNSFTNTHNRKINIFEYYILQKAVHFLQDNKGDQIAIFYFYIFFKNTMHTIVF